MSIIINFNFYFLSVFDFSCFLTQLWSLFLRWREAVCIRSKYRINSRLGSRVRFLLSLVSTISTILVVQLLKQFVWITRPTRDKNEMTINIKFQELSFPVTLSDKFQQIASKFATLNLFYPFLSCFFCIKFLFKNVIVCVRIKIRTRNLRNLQIKLTVWITIQYCTLKPPKNITQSNNKVGFSVTHFISNFIPLKFLYIANFILFLKIFLILTREILLFMNDRKHYLFWFSLLELLFWINFSWESNADFFFHSKLVSSRLFCSWHTSLSSSQNARGREQSIYVFRL